MILLKHKPITISPKQRMLFLDQRGGLYSWKEMTMGHERRPRRRRQHKRPPEAAPHCSLTCAVSRMAFSNSRYASHSAVPFVTCSPTAVNARSNIERTFSIPPS